nr:hypothetical protein [Desulfobacterales bacterium]
MAIGVEPDVDRDGRPADQYCYREGILKLTEIDEDSDGDIDVREDYNAQGKLIKSQEKDRAADRMDITWFYNESEEAVRPERDGNRDGRVDTWYY